MVTTIKIRLSLVIGLYLNLYLLFWIYSCYSDSFKFEIVLYSDSVYIILLLFSLYKIAIVKNVGTYYL